MSLIDVILNLAGMLLWLSWRSIRVTPVAMAPAMSLLSTLKRAETAKSSRWTPLIGLLVLLAARAVLYWHIGSAVHWMATLQLGAITLLFRSDYLGRMLLFSALSFGQVLTVFYLWLFLLSALNKKGQESNPILKLIRLHLGWLDRMPTAGKFLAPLCGGALIWFFLNPLLAQAGILPPSQSSVQLWQQALVLGASAYLAWKYAIIALLLLHLLNSYVYLGNYSFWTFINTTARRVLGVLDWLPLRLGKVDFAPLIVVAVVFLAAELGSRGLTQLYQRLPL